MLISLECSTLLFRLYLVKKYAMMRQLLNTYRLPTKSLEGNVFSHVLLSVILSTSLFCSPGFPTCPCMHKFKPVHFGPQALFKLFSWGSPGLNTWGASIVLPTWEPLQPCLLPRHIQTCVLGTL